MYVCKNAGEYFVVFLPPDCLIVAYMALTLTVYFDPGLQIDTIF